MTDLEHKIPASRPRGILSVRRFALLATTVAGLGAAALVVPPTVDPAANFLATAALAQNLSAEAKSVPSPAGFADVVAKVKPAVISVRVKNRGGLELSANNELPSLEHFFRRFGMPDGVTPNWPNDRDGAMPDRPRRRQFTGQGSGFFISADGYAVTNYHVIDGADTVEVATDDGKTYTAKVVGRDQRTDLALIKVEGNNFPFVKLAEKAPRIGDWVLAVGNPFGLSSTVTAGIVSARGRDIGAGPYDDFIQIDAPVNRGNSGGPAFDIDGNVMGVNAAIFSPSGGNVGIAFAIPAETVKMVVDQLREKGSVTRGWLGVQIQAVTADLAESLGLKKPEGALVAEPQSGSPASKAGIKAGDVIISIDGKPVEDARDLARKIAAMAPGSAIKFGIMRNGAEQMVTVTLGEMAKQRDAKAGSGTDEPRIGLTIAPAGTVSGAGGQGVVVTSVEPNGIAAGQGFRTGDVILEVGGHAVSTPEDVSKALKDARGADKRSVLMRVKSGEATKFVAVPLARA